MKHIILCADDYAQNEATSKGILTAIKAGRISATSCLVNNSNWPEYAKWLAEFKDKVDIGWHINLSDGGALGEILGLTSGRFLPTLGKLLVKSTLRLLRHHAIYDELMRQLEMFETHMGVLPDFIDGHQHVHHLPIVRKALLEVYEKNFTNKKPFIRSVANIKKISSGNFKVGVIKHTGAVKFDKILKARGIPHNSSFSGSYDFAYAHCYEEFFCEFLAQIEDGGIIMCHPGYYCDGDILGKSRPLELGYLMSDHFPNDLKAAKVRLVRFN